MKRPHGNMFVLVLLGVTAGRRCLSCSTIYIIESILQINQMSGSLDRCNNRSTLDIQKNWIYYRHHNNKSRSNNYIYILSIPPFNYYQEGDSYM